MQITESDKNGRTIVKNQKDIDNWKALDGRAMAILSTSVELAFIEGYVSATLSYELLSKLKAKSEILKQVLWDHFYGITKTYRDYQLVRFTYCSCSPEVAQHVGDV